MKVLSISLCAAVLATSCSRYKPPIVTSSAHSPQESAIVDYGPLFAQARASASIASVSNVEKLFPDGKGEFETSAEYQRRLEQNKVDAETIFYLDAPVEFVSFDADASRTHVKIKGGAICFGAQTSSGCSSQNSPHFMFPVTSDVKFTTYDASNAFGVSRQVVSKTGFERYLYPRPFSLRSEKASIPSPNFDGLYSALTAQLDVSRDYARSLSSKQSKLFARIGFTVCGETGNCQGHSATYIKPTVTSPVSAMILIHYLTINLRSVVFLDNTSKEIKEVFVAGP